MQSLPQSQISCNKIAAAKRETKSAQAHRLVDYLLANGPTLTGQLCQACAIGNISAAANAIRPALLKQGIALTATLPHPLSHNRFDEPSMAHTWALRGIR